MKKFLRRKSFGLWIRKSSIPSHLSSIYQRLAHSYIQWSIQSLNHEIYLYIKLYIYISFKALKLQKDSQFLFPTHLKQWSKNFSIYFFKEKIIYTNLHSCIIYILNEFESRYDNGNDKQLIFPNSIHLVVSKKINK